MKGSVVRVPAPALLGMSKVLGAALLDVLVTADEYRAMADGLADPHAPSTGKVSQALGVGRRAPGHPQPPLPERA